MDYKKTPGKRISKLPKFLHPTAIAVRNIIVSIPFLNKKEIRESEKDVIAKLKMGVEYIVGCEVTGDVAEFGTASGKTAKTIAAAIKNYDFTNTKKLHLFDSFEGLPESTESSDKNSPMVKSGRWGKGKYTGLSKNELETSIKQFLPETKIFLYEGWFNKTVKEIAPGTKFSMLHIDCDLYSSTIEVLDHLFDNKIIAEGAIIFFDDYNGNKASPQHGERKAWSEIIKKFNVEYSDGGDYGAGSKKFIIHSYII
jgi:hypothetical protein